MILPGATIGIIGGGQLGRMLAMAAAALGYKTIVFTPENDSPAAQVAGEVILAEYSNTKALQTLAEKCDVTTFEFESIPHESLEVLEAHTHVCPSANILRIARNRVREKTFINELGIGTAPFRKVTSSDELKQAVSELGLPAILKTTELGYDGKGQLTLRDKKDVADAWKKLKTSEAILEGFVDFTMEISVIVARGVSGESKCFEPVENIHKNHILDRTVVPAKISKASAEQAIAIAINLADALELRGLLAVEMFVTSEGNILVNELAPRPHNSGHWSIDAATTSQFEQAIRAVCGLPLGNPQRLCDAEMKNLIGDDVEALDVYLNNPNAKLHLYGKHEARKGRKMGHVTTLHPHST